MTVYIYVYFFICSIAKLRTSVYLCIVGVFLFYFVTHRHCDFNFYILFLHQHFHIVSLRFVIQCKSDPLRISRLSSTFNNILLFNGFVFLIIVTVFVPLFYLVRSIVLRSKCARIIDINSCLILTPLKYELYGIVRLYFSNNTCQCKNYNYFRTFEFAFNEYNTHTNSYVRIIRKASKYSIITTTRIQFSELKIELDNTVKNRRVYYVIFKSAKSP